MRQALLVDTGVSYALVDPSDQYFERARQETQRVEQGWQVFIAHPTFLEAHALVLHKLGTRVAQKWLKEVKLAAGFINVTAEDYEEAVELIEMYEDQTITLFDAVLAVLSKRLSLPIWTYDRNFDILHAAVWR